MAKGWVWRRSERQGSATPDLAQHESGHSGNERGEANHRQRKKAKLDANHGAPCSEPQHGRQLIKEMGTEVVIPAIHCRRAWIASQNWIAREDALPSSGNVRGLGGRTRLLMQPVSNAPELPWSSPA